MPMSLHQAPGQQQQPQQQQLPPLQHTSGQGLAPPARGMPQFNGGFRASNFQSQANSVPYAAAAAPLIGQKRDSAGLPLSPSGQNPSDSGDGNFVKLFVGSVPRTITEEEVRPMFAEHGNVLEVALIKDKNTGQQQGCCFIKYATFEEADRAIRYIHNQKTLPGGTAPVQVRYADGERERLGAMEHKLFVGCLNRQASEKEIEEIFAPYGRVVDVYVMRDEMKQSRGCAFVKYPSREMATAAINALNGTYIMRGCDQPLSVRYADPKRTRVGDTRVGGPGFGGPGFNSRPVAGPYGPRPSLGPGGPMGSRGSPMGWHPSIGGPGPGVGPRPQGGPGSYSMSPRGGPESSPSQPTGALGALPGPAPAQVPYSVPAQIGGPGQTGGVGQMVGSTNSTQQQYYQQAAQRPPQSFGQQSSLQLPQQQLPSVPLQSQQPQVYGQQLKPQPLQQLQQQQQQLPTSTLQPQIGSLPSHSQQFHSLQSTQHQHPTLQPQFAQLQPASQQYTALQVPQQMQQQSLPFQQAQQQQPASLSVHSIPQQQPQLSLSSQTAYQLPLPQQQQQPQLQPQPQSQPQPQPQSQPQPQPQPQQQQVFHQVTPLQHPLQQQQSWMLTSQAQPLSLSVPLPVVPAPTIAACNWTEHTSPEGHKYYYNSITGESKWEKPDELSKFEQQQQQQQQQQQTALPQPVSSVSYGAPSTTTQHASQGFTYGQPQLNNGSVDQFRQQIR